MHIKPSTSVFRTVVVFFFKLRTPFVVLAALFVWPHFYLSPPSHPPQLGGRSHKGSRKRWTDLEKHRGNSNNLSTTIIIARTKTIMVLMKAGLTNWLMNAGLTSKREVWPVKSHLQDLCKSFSYSHERQSCLRSYTCCSALFTFTNQFYSVLLLRAK